jgi:serine/threonine-protein kinase HipA
MGPQCTVQLFADDTWHDVATVLQLGPEEQGCLTQTYSGYAIDWVLTHGGARDAWAVASQMPVVADGQSLPHWPVALIDMLPQGYGRTELLRQLNLPEGMAASADWRLLLTGAGNPVGHLRIKEAAQWLAERAGPKQGFTDADVADRATGFIDHLGMHGLFVAGSSGVQGEWPKLLLTRARDGLLYLDHTVDDADAVEHFIVKFGRGADKRLASILRHEAPYMRVAERLGLRVHAPLGLRGEALFIPRFDRRVVAGRVQRLAQESLATLTGRAGFGVAPSHDEVCRKLAATCSDPAGEILEYLRRDVANIAFGNRDNHARNTAVQRDFAGRIALTPLFDFAPMYLHPDGIARRIRWEGNDGGAPDWARVLDQVCAECRLPREPLAAGLAAMVPGLREIAANGPAFGIETDVLDFLAPNILAQADVLESLR